MSLRVQVQCKRCGTRTELPPGSAPAPLCGTCAKHSGAPHPDTLLANRAYRAMKRLHGIDPETGARKLSPFQRGAFAFVRRQR